MQIVNHVSANYIYLLALLSYAVTYMLYAFIQTDMIFSKYGEWLRKEECFNKIADANNAKNKDYIITKVRIPVWKKPIGLCLKCTHIWVHTIIVLIGILFLEQSLNILYFLFSIAWSYTKLIEKYYN